MTVYHDWSLRKNQTDNEWSDELNVWFDAPEEDPDLGLALVMLSAAMYDEIPFLGVVSAGMLEDLLNEANDEFLDRILAEARKTPRFMWLLSGVWTMSMNSYHAKAIKELVGRRTFDDPLPPRPRV